MLNYQRVSNMTIYDVDYDHLKSIRSCLISAAGTLRQCWFLIGESVILNGDPLALTQLALENPLRLNGKRSVE